MPDSKINNGKPPDKKQVFQYHWELLKDGAMLVNNRDIVHAIGNCDLYPTEIGKGDTPEERAATETVNAVVAAIDATPKYRLRRRVMVDLNDLVSALESRYPETLGETCARPVDLIALATDLSITVDMVGKEAADG